MENSTQNKLIVVCLFILTFVVIGTVAPIAYLSIAPDDHFVDIDSFEATDTYSSADSHTVCFDRNVKKQSDADITIELLLLRADGEVIEVDSFDVDALLQEGDETVLVEREIQKRLEPGTYKYIHALKLDYANGWISKEFTFESNNFTVYDSENDYKQNSTHKHAGCSE